MTQQHSSPAPSGRSAIVLLSHRLCDATLERYHELIETIPEHMDLIPVLTEPLGRAAAACGVRNAVILDRDQIFLEEYGKKAVTCRVTPGNTDLAMLAVHRIFPQYRSLWLWEYDVWVAGGANLIAAVDVATDAELIMPLGIRPRVNSVHWVHWRSFRPAMNSERNLAPEHVTQGLQCLARYSATLLDRIDWAYKEGWTGHHEAVVPTIANHHSMSIRTLRSVIKEVLGIPGITGKSFRHRGTLPDPGAMIYHPVKTERAASELRMFLSPQFHARNKSPSDAVRPPDPPRDTAIDLKEGK
jgi:hypothetical protein